uniref:Peptide-methionine (R)-S-oxide reductase n=1 Tax=Calcidiscus leptoporus TaxID=127549 RepID=A0A7S0P3N8_9EUKA
MAAMRSTAVRGSLVSTRALVLRRGGSRMAENDQGVSYKLVRTAEEWQQLLSPHEFNILRKKGTEYPGTGEYDKFYPKEGHFACAACPQPLYSAQSKFDSGCGWPAFDKIVEGAVVTRTDRSLGMARVEIMCGNCGGHLGHVFEGEGFTPTMERHCVNSASVRYVDEPLPASLSEAKVLPAYKPPAEKVGNLLKDLFKGGMTK